MSGHSKWASIKHKKAVVDAAPRPALHQARARDHRRRAGGRRRPRRQRIAGAGDPEGPRRVDAEGQHRARDPEGHRRGRRRRPVRDGVYEGYAPGGVAMLIEALTDNRNRTAADVRHIVGKHGGNLGEPGSVAYLFEKQGVIVVDASRYDEDDLIVAIDAGAQDIVARRRRLRDRHRADRADGRARRAGRGRDRGRQRRADAATEDTGAGRARRTRSNL
jgi:hypothetical protein